uniref:RWD domain-containing protein n=1 Tax=Ascaris lumbricoides TaxID=6252 RepID=A0A0M3ILF1_ASCLU
MVAADEQATELEVLQSIFDGDQRFSVVANNKFQVKEHIVSRLKQEAESYLGMAATFTLIEYVKEHFDDLIKDQVESATMAEEASNLRLSSSESDTENAKKVNTGNKIQMSKAQKRRMWDRTDASKLGQAERGWNWVDILGHLSQTRDT